MVVGSTGVTHGEFTFNKLHRTFVADCLKKLDAESEDWFKNPYHYEEARSALKLMRQVQIWDQHKSWLEDAVDFTDKDIRKDTITHTTRSGRRARTPERIAGFVAQALVCRWHDLATTTEGQAAGQETKPQGKRPSHWARGHATVQETKPDGKKPSHRARGRATGQETKPQGKTRQETKPHGKRPSKRRSYGARGHATEPKGRYRVKASIDEPR